VNLAAPPPPTEQSNVTALILSVLVHVLLIGALFLGVQWKSEAPATVAVEVWRSAPSPKPMPVVKPEPKPEPPPPPKIEPMPEPKPAPKVEPAPTIKPDIAIKEEPKPKKEEPKPEPKKPEPKKEEPKPEPKKPEPKKPEPAPRPNFDDELNRDLKQTQQQKILQDQRARAEAELNQLGQLKAEQAAAALARGQAEYIARIAGKIRGHIVLPAGIQDNPEGVFEVTQLPTGEVLSVRIRKSSGNKLLDEAVERAILKSSPLPKPDDPKLFSRDLKIPYRPKIE
jgi:colicin import membrane protein